jgi:transposase
MSKQIVHTKEFKQEAVRLTISSGKSVAQIAKDLGISTNALYTWLRLARGEGRLPVAESETLEQKVKRLERELRIVSEERDIIKKAMAYFAQPQAR